MIKKINTKEYENYEILLLSFYLSIYLLISLFIWPQYLIILDYLLEVLVKSLFGKLFKKYYAICKIVYMRPWVLILGSLAWFVLSPYTHLESRGIHLQSIGCVLGGKSRVEIPTLNTQLPRLGQLLAKPRGVVPKKIN
jgi:hypothetical protein